MQLHNRLSNLFQKETNRLFKSFLDENPDLLKKYVTGGVSAVGAILGPINTFMRHLLTVQGLDPDSVPGETQRLQLQDALYNFFSGSHEKDFDDDYDLSWVQKKFEETRKQMNRLDMTKQQFTDLTDLSRLPNLGRVADGPVTIDSGMDELAELNQIAPETPKRELPLETKEGRQAFREKVLAEAKDFLRSQERENTIEVFDIGNPIDALREAVKAIEKETGLDKKKKKGLKTTKKKLNKTTVVKKPTKVKRVPNVEPVKEEPTTLEVQADRKNHIPSRRAPGRSLTDLASQNRARIKAVKESTPEFQAQLKAKIARATQLTNLMVEKGLCEVDDKSRQDQIQSMINWTDNNFDSLERVIMKYAPTKDAVAENKFKGSFRRVMK